MRATVGRSRQQVRFHPTAKAYEALGIRVPRHLRAPWWRRLLAAVKW